MKQRKVYGIKMWRFGYAAQLILSVCRFEWRKFRYPNPESDGEFEVLVNHVPPPGGISSFIWMDRQPMVLLLKRASRGHDPNPEPWGIFQ
jgi:hypothetical protein